MCDLDTQMNGTPEANLARKRRVCCDMRAYLVTCIYVRLIWRRRAVAVFCRHIRGTHSQIFAYTYLVAGNKIDLKSKNIYDVLLESRLSSLAGRTSHTVYYSFSFSFSAPLRLPISSSRLEPDTAGCPLPGKLLNQASKMCC